MNTKSLQETIRKVLKEELNESTYLRRRVDMSSLDEEFYENLDIVTNRFLKLSSKKQYYSFNDFKNAILGYIIEDFHYELTNNRFDDYPYDEVYEFLSNHYHDKIKDRYVEVFGGNINESETIRRVLREETNVPLSFRRRITNSDIEEEFLKALDSIDYSRLHNQFSPIKNISLKTFAKLVIDEMYMYLEKDYFSDEDSLLFDDDKIYHEKIRVPLMSYFGDRIKKRYNGNNINESESIRRVLSESINKSDEKRNKLIKKIMDNIIFTEYNHIICGYDVKNDEVFNKPVVNVTFIGGYGTKLWPVTQGIQKMYSDILDEIWNTIYDYINIPVGVTMNTTTKCL